LPGVTGTPPKAPASKEEGSKVAPILAIMLVGGFVVALMVFTKVKIPAENEASIQGLLETMKTLVAVAVSYYLGSSKEGNVKK